MKTLEYLEWEEQQRKQKHSKKKKKTPKKSDHKHIYEDVIFDCGDNDFMIGSLGIVKNMKYVKGKRCVFCGKEDKDFCTFLPIENEKHGKCYRMVVGEELLELFPTLPVYKSVEKF